MVTAVRINDEVKQKINHHIPHRCNLFHFHHIAVVVHEIAILVKNFGDGITFFHKIIRMKNTLPIRVCILSGKAGPAAPITNFFGIGFINRSKLHLFDYHIHQIFPTLPYKKRRRITQPRTKVVFRLLLSSFGSGGGDRTPDLTGMNRTLLPAELRRLTYQIGYRGRI